MSKPYKSGDYLCICDRCGFEYYRSELRKTWDNLLVCKVDFEVRHPQDSVRPKRDKIRVEEARPEGADVFLSPGDVTADDL